MTHNEEDIYDPYAVIETFWGEPLSQELIGRIVNAPRDHLRQFAPILYKAAIEAVPPRLAAGELRPEIRITNGDIMRGQCRSQVGLGLNMLLYAHSVVMDPPLGPSVAEIGPKELERQLGLLLALRPLFLSKALQFAVVTSRTHHPSIAGEVGKIFDRLFSDGAATITPPSSATKDSDPGSRLLELVEDVYTPLILASRWAGRLHPLIHGNEEYQILCRIVSAAAAQANRRVAMCKLAGLDVPRLANEINLLVSLRENESVFADWRHHLGIALDRIADISDGSSYWQEDAKSLVLDEMSGPVVRANRLVKNSSVLSSIRIGTTELGLTALGAAAGAVVADSLSAPVIAAATTLTMRTAAKWIGSRPDRRAGLAVLDMCALLIEQ
jgi:hypothetical protein